MQWNGPVLELARRAARGSGRTSSPSRRDLEAMLARLRRADADARLGEALRDQRLVAGIGNMWMAEALWEARSRRGCGSRDVSEASRRRALETAARQCARSVDARPRAAACYRRAGRPCPRCGTPIRSRGQGDDNRIAYWCPACQVGGDPPGA